MRFLTALALLVAVSGVQAQQNFPRDVEVCWTNATEYEDGTPLGADLTGIRIEYYRNADTVPAFTAEIPALGAEQCETFVASVDQPGTYTIVGYSIALGLYSAASDPVIRKFIPPNKPTNIRTD